VSCERTAIEAGADCQGDKVAAERVAAAQPPSPEPRQPPTASSAKPADKRPLPPAKEDSSPSPEEMRAAFAKMVASLEPVDDPDAPPNPLAGCVTCHADVETAYKAGGHNGEDVDCVTCHGASEGHVADENNEVKPDELYARKDVDRLCGHCHDCTREKGATPPPDPGTQRPVCIDCHGAHDPALTGLGVTSRPITD